MSSSDSELPASLLPYPPTMQDSETEDLSLGDVFTVCLNNYLDHRFHKTLIPIYHSRNHRVHQHPRRPTRHTLEALTNQRKTKPSPISKSASSAPIRFGHIICTAIRVCDTHQTLLTSFVRSRWNAALALASYIDSNPEIARNRCILELGAGGGLPGLVAAQNDATKVCTSTLPLNLPPELTHRTGCINRLPGSAPHR